VVYSDSIDYVRTVRVRQLSTGATTEIDSSGDCGGGLADFESGPSAAFLPDGRTVIYGTRIYTDYPKACSTHTSTDVTSRTVEQPHWATLTTWRAYAEFVDLDSAPTGSLYVVATDADSKDRLGRLYLDKGMSAALALAQLDAYLADANNVALRPEALFGKATALERLGRSADATVIWRTLLADFPDSAYTAQARERVDASKER